MTNVCFETEKNWALSSKPVIRLRSISSLVTYLVLNYFHKAKNLCAFLTAENGGNFYSTCTSTSLV